MCFKFYNTNNLPFISLLARCWFVLFIDPVISQKVLPDARETPHLGQKLFMFRVKEASLTMLNWQWSFHSVFKCSGPTVSMEMGLREVLVCLAALKALSQPLPFIRISHRLFVDLMTWPYYMSVPRTRWKRGSSSFSSTQPLCHLKIHMLSSKFWASEHWPWET